MAEVKLIFDECKKLYVLDVHYETPHVIEY